MRRFYLQIVSTNIAIPTSFSAIEFSSYWMAEDTPLPPIRVAESTMKLRIELVILYHWDGGRYAASPQR